MSKDRTTYGKYSVTNIVTRSSVPSQDNMAILESKVLCSNITTARIRNALSESTNDIGSLYTSAKVNTWSEFGPWYRTHTSTAFSSHLDNNRPVEYKMGDFACYNHAAMVPGWTSTGYAIATTNIYIDPSLGSTVTFHANVNIGELDYQAFGAATATRLVMWNINTGLIVGTSIWRPLIDCWDTDVDYQITLLDQHTGENYQGMIYITSDAAEDTDIAENGSTIVCKVPNTEAGFYVNVVEMTDSGLTVTHTNNTGTPLTVVGDTFDLVTGTCGFTSASSITSYEWLTIKAYLRDEGGTQIGSLVEFRHHGNIVPYNSLAVEGPYSGQPGGQTNLAAHGNHFVIEFVYGPLVPD
jgi:hypothetical protein